MRCNAPKTSPNVRELKMQLSHSVSTRKIGFVGLYHDKPFEVSVKKVNGIKVTRQIEDIGDFITRLRHMDEASVPILEATDGQMFSVLGLAGIHPGTGKAILVLTPADR